MAGLTLDDRAERPPTIGFARDTLNTAICLKRLLGEPAGVTFANVSGQDPFSERIINFIRSDSIGTEAIARSAGRSIGLHAISTDTAGERIFSYWRSESAAKILLQDGGALNFDVLADFEVRYFSAITLAILPSTVRKALLIALARLRSAHGTLMVFDSNYRPALWELKEEARRSIAAAWRIMDIAIPSIDDEQALFADLDETSVLTRLRGYGTTRGALKRGPLGPTGLTVADKVAGRSQIDDDFAAATAVDSTAARNSFNAGYLSAALAGASDQEARIAGHQCSVRVIAHPGGTIPREIWCATNAQRNVITRDLESQFISGTLPDNYPLQAGKDLSVEYSASRTVIREVIAALTNRGMLENLPHFRPIVRKPGFDAAFKTMGGIVQYLTQERSGIEALYQGRIFLERTLVREDAIRAQIEDIRDSRAALAANHESIQSSKEFYVADVAFHHVFYQILRNPLFPAAHQAYTLWLSEPWNRMERSSERNTQNFEYHKAIIDRDADATETAPEPSCQCLRTCEKYNRCKTQPMSAEN